LNEQPASTAKMLYTIREVAEMLRLSRSELYGCVLRGELQSLKLGRRRLIRLEAVHDFSEKLQRVAEARHTGDRL
jgi:excisionase family DNA binding protein